MKIEYFSDTDTLSIVLAGARFMPWGEDTADPDITLIYDDDHRLAEIEIEHASKRVDLAELRARLDYREYGEPNPKAIRERLGLSQAAFAARLGISVRSLQNWEQGHRAPTGPAAQLLRIADRHPEVFLTTFAEQAA